MWALLFVPARLVGTCLAQAQNVSLNLVLNKSTLLFVKASDSVAILYFMCEEGF